MYTQLRSATYGRQHRHTLGAGIYTNDRGQTYVEATWNDHGYLVYASVPAETVTVEVVDRPTSWLVTSLTPDGDTVVRTWHGDDPDHVREQIADSGDFADETILTVEVSK